MSDAEIQAELLKQFEQLPLPQKQRVLRYTRTLVDAPPKGVPGDRLLRFAGIMSHEEAQEFIKSIDEECERVDFDEG